MNTQEQIQHLKGIVDAVQDELTKLKEQVEQEKVDNWPEMGGTYYFINDHGRTDTCKWYNDIVDQYRKATGNFYRTRKDAETAQKIQKRAIELRGSWVADWGDRSQSKYYFSWCYYSKRAETSSACLSRDQGVFYMPDEAVETLQKEFTNEELRLWVCGGV